MITSSKIKTVQDKIRKALAKIEQEENITIEFGGCKYNSAFYRTEMKVKTTESSDVVKETYTTTCRILGFTQNVIGMTYESLGTIYEIVDIKTKNRKYPIIVKVISGTKEIGKMYKMTTESVKKGLGGDKLINRNANIENLLK
jgi:hypothetical protein